MATKAEAMKRGCLVNAAPDEPVFILRAQDLVAPAAVRAWAEYARRAGTPEAKCKAAEKVAADMDAWRLVNGGKVPD